MISETQTQRREKLLVVWGSPELLENPQASAMDLPSTPRASSLRTSATESFLRLEQGPNWSQQQRPKNLTAVAQGQVDPE